jgi:uncharacterized membrane protein (UPF0182 family)
MPELKKVAVGFGTQIGYGNTYAEALAQLGSGFVEAKAISAAGAPAAKTENSAASSARPSDARIEKVRTRLLRYKELMGQGKYVEAARELEAIEAEIKP